MTQLAHREGFVSAVEAAFYERTLVTIAIELDRSGVARSFGNDMLPAGLSLLFPVQPCS